MQPEGIFLVYVRDRYHLTPPGNILTSIGTPPGAQLLAVMIPGPSADVWPRVACFFILLFFLNIFLHFFLFLSYEQTCVRAFSPPFPSGRSPMNRDEMRISVTYSHSPSRRQYDTPDTYISDDGFPAIYRASHSPPASRLFGELRGPGPRALVTRTDTDRPITSFISYLLNFSYFFASAQTKLGFRA